MSAMRRREFVSLLSGAAAWPFAAGAQQLGKLPTIGFLHYGSPGPSPEVDAFRQGLRDLGYIEGKNINIEYRFASGRVERLPELAAELVHLKPDVSSAQPRRGLWPLNKQPAQFPSSSRA